jgi:hypothetical protein
MTAYLLIKHLRTNYNWIIRRSRYTFTNCRSIHHTVDQRTPLPAIGDHVSRSEIISTPAEGIQKAVTIEIIEYKHS